MLFILIQGTRHLVCCSHPPPGKVEEKYTAKLESNENRTQDTRGCAKTLVDERQDRSIGLLGHFISATPTPRTPPPRLLVQPPINKMKWGVERGDLLYD